MVTCQICNKTYKSNQPLSKHITYAHNISKIDYYDTYIKTTDEGKCLICGKPTKYHDLSTGYRKYCCKSCQIKAQDTKIDHNKMWEIRNRKIEEYENKNNCTHITKIYNKYGTNIKDIPIIYISKMYQYIDNSYIPILEKQHIKKSIKKISLSKDQLNRQFEQEHNCTQIKTLIEQYGQGWLSLKLPRLHRGHNAHFISNDYLCIIQEYASINHTYRSEKENRLYDIVKNHYDKPIYQNARKIIPHFELDLYLPDIKVAVEYNGIKWHCIENNTDKEYHLNKSIACREKGIRLIHIYEFESFNKQVELLIDFLNGNDNYPKNDFNKNNLIEKIPKPKIIYQTKRYTIYGAGELK